MELISSASFGLLSHEFHYPYQYLSQLFILWYLLRLPSRRFQYSRQFPPFLIDLVIACIHRQIRFYTSTPVLTKKDVYRLTQVRGNFLLTCRVGTCGTYQRMSRSVQSLVLYVRLNIQDPLCVHGGVFNIGFYERKFTVASVRSQVLSHFSQFNGGKRAPHV